jgi:predicted nucleic acid-binding protein
MIAESEIITAILERCYLGEWELLGSEVVESEISKTPDDVKRELALMRHSIAVKIDLSEHVYNSVKARSVELQQYQLGLMDSLHLAYAEYAGVDVLLTVDINFIKRAQRAMPSVKVMNPVDWYKEITNEKERAGAGY